MYPATQTRSASHGASDSAAPEAAPSSATKVVTASAYSAAGGNRRVEGDRRPASLIRKPQVGVDQVPTNHFPAVKTLCSGPAALTEPPAEVAIVEHGANGASELGRVVADENVLTVNRL